ncbi:helix-turn-helix domain-containing protein [Candidatus Pacearchaeota archaeon]|nr:helix-turn-helix domain-containing protein [Candidatus Pacearchaeota archaeon]
MEKLITIQQLCDLIQVSRSTVYEWTHIGFIPHYKFPNGVRFRISDIEKWLKKRMKSGRIEYCKKVL